MAIYIDAEATYTGAGHVVTDGLGLTVGEPLEHELFLGSEYFHAVT